jgi:hypothetical protein
MVMLWFVDVDMLDILIIIIVFYSLSLFLLYLAFDMVDSAYGCLGRYWSYARL